MRYIRLQADGYARDMNFKKCSLRNTPETLTVQRSDRIPRREEA